jgi:hypothetical protein
MVLLLGPAPERPVDRSNELGVVDRLFDEVFGAGLDCRYRHGDVRMTGNEYDRKRDIAAREFAHEAYSIGSGHPHIGDDASRTLPVQRPKKGIGRRVGLDGVSEHAEHLAQRFAYRSMIVYDKDGWGRYRHGNPA